MSVSKLWTNWAFVLDTVAEGETPVVIPGIQSMEVSSGLQTRMEGGDGSVYNSFASLVAGAPVIRGSTTALKALLDVCGVTGKEIDNDGDNDGAECYFQRLTQGGTRDAYSETTHFLITVANGLLVLRSLDLSHQTPASLSFELFARQDGATAPLVFAEGAAHPDEDPTSAPQWTLGKVDLNGTQVDGLSSVSIDFGVEVVPDSRDSDIYPTFLCIRRIQPMITLRGVHPDITATLTEDGLSYAASEVAVYARKRDDGGTFVADGTAEHIKFTLGKCRIDWDSIAGDPKEIGMTIRPYDTPGGTAPLTISTASAIT